MKKITTLLLMLIAPMIIGHTTFDDRASASEEIVIGNCDVQCPDDIEVTADANDEFTIPDYVANGTVTVTCDGGTITQNPAPGTIVGPGTTVITITAVNATDDDDCDLLLPSSRLDRPRQLPDKAALPPQQSPLMSICP